MVYNCDGLQRSCELVYKDHVTWLSEIMWHGLQRCDIVYKYHVTWFAEMVQILCDMVYSDHVTWFPEIMWQGLQGSCGMVYWSCDMVYRDHVTWLYLGVGLQRSCDMVYKDHVTGFREIYLIWFKDHMTLFRDHVTCYTDIMWHGLQCMIPHDHDSHDLYWVICITNGVRLFVQTIL